MDEFQLDQVDGEDSGSDEGLTPEELDAAEDAANDAYYERRARIWY